eukprot:TRINITY_DN5275_c0_g7_i1.p1 TRINITY_DN5275_c0_g7~~TRINITY_DN5275_c0_g7_i1.p1  ORF type:complete len:567 (-),score=125.81 TRINITY_DN5275_c0_g7_i1:40-1740(-)
MKRRRTIRVLKLSLIQMSLVKKRTICGTITQNYELNIFLYTTFQEILEQSEALLSKPPPNKYKPFEYKHAAREKLKQFLKNPYLLLSPDAKTPSNALQLCANALLRYQLGVNYSETGEWKQAEEEFNAALQLFNQLPQDIKLRHINTLQDMFNRFGVIWCNRGESKRAIVYFAKAKEMYNAVKDAQGLRIVNQFTEFIKKTTGAPEQRECFGFFIDGGLNRTRLDTSYSKSLLYLAQAYTKLNKATSVAYCARSLRHQIDCGKFSVEDWAVNCVSLSSYFLENHNFAQAEYCLWATVAVLAKNKNERLGAEVGMQMGKYYGKRLEYGIEQLKGGEIEVFRKEATKKFVEFPSLNIPWPVIEEIKNLEKAKEFFRLANTQYKKALRFFAQESNLEQQIELHRGIAELYKTLASLEPDPSRLIAMLERRREILEPLSSRIQSAENCSAQVQEIWYELSAVYAEMHGRLLVDCGVLKGGARSEAMDDANRYALKSAEYSKKLISLLKGLKEQNEEIMSAMLSQYMNIAKVYSEVEFEDAGECIKYYKESLLYYETVSYTHLTLPTICSV